MKRTTQLQAMRRLITGMGASVLALAASGTALAQDQGGAAAAEEDESAFGTIVVTATKRADAQDVQSVPLAVTAFGAEQLEDQHVRTLDNLGFSVPNVQLDDVGTAPGFANFSIRGLGINSSTNSQLHISIRCSIA
jgi:iron complex outermembrane receptor protein